MRFFLYDRHNERLVSYKLTMTELKNFVIINQNEFGEDYE